MAKTVRCEFMESFEIPTHRSWQRGFFFEFAVSGWEKWFDMV
jgi:hypothetical protein